MSNSNKAGLPVMSVRSSEGIGALTIYFADGAIPKVGDRFCLECYDVNDLGRNVSLSFRLAPLSQQVEDVSPVIYRYLRPQDYDRETDSPHNLGGVTFAFVINYTKNTVTTGTAICDDDWNFNKGEGRRVALENLSRSPIEFTHDPKQPLVRGLLGKVFEDKDVRSKNPKLAKVLFRIMADRISMGV